MIKKLSASAGHTLTSTGADGFKNEKSEVDKIFEHFKRLHKENNKPFVDCSPINNLPTFEHLYTRVAKCNTSESDFYVEFHLNASEDEKANGVEVLGYNVSNDEALKLLKNLSILGFKNRGYKQRQDLYVLKNTNCKALIIEFYFCTNKEDCLLADKIGHEKLARVVYESLHNTKKKYKINIETEYEYEDLDLAKAQLETLKVIGIKGTIKEV